LQESGWKGDTPLWYYILREAYVCKPGNRLDPVGGRIVTEVLLGLIHADSTSFRRRDGNWQARKVLSKLLVS